MTDRPTLTLPRAEAVQATRRRRQDTGQNAGMKLFVPESAKDPNFEHRWFNDEPGRLQSKTEADDWDLVDINQMNGYGAEKQAEGGTRVVRYAEKGATGAGGQPRKMFLARKRKEYYEADNAKRQSGYSAVEQSLRDGIPNTPGGLDGPTAYVPDGRNIVNGR